MKGVGFVGAGKMGEAMILGIAGAKLLPSEEIFVFDKRPGRGEELRRLYGVSVAADLPHLLRECDTIVFAVKPEDVPIILREFPSNHAEKLFISIAAGARAAVFLAALGEDHAVVRAMPNTPALVGMGTTGLYYSKGVTESQRIRTRALFSSFGTVAEFPQEDLLDVVTALSGSGPAFVFLFIEALADGAVRAGMGRDEAMLLAASTVEGAARLVRETGTHPGVLKDAVTSPGGTTAAGIAALEQGAFRGTVMDAVFAAWRRCRELST